LWFCVLHLVPILDLCLLFVIVVVVVVVVV